MEEEEEGAKNQRERDNRSRGKLFVLRRRGRRSLIHSVFFEQRRRRSREYRKRASFNAWPGSGDFTGMRCWPFSESPYHSESYLGSCQAQTLQTTKVFLLNHVHAHFPVLPFRLRDSILRCADLKIHGHITVRVTYVLWMCVDVFARDGSVCNMLSMLYVQNFCCDFLCSPLCCLLPNSFVRRLHVSSPPPSSCVCVRPGTQTKQSSGPWEESRLLRLLRLQ